MKPDTSETYETLTEAKSLWTVKEVAGFLRLKPETVRMMARRGELPALKVGRGWRFEMRAIEKYLQLTIKLSP